MTDMYYWDMIYFNQPENQHEERYLYQTFRKYAEIPCH